MTRLCDLMHDTRPLALPPTVVVKRACEEMCSHHTSAVLVTHPDGHLLGYCRRQGCSESHPRRRDDEESDNDFSPHYSHRGFAPHVGRGIPPFARDRKRKHRRPRVAAQFQKRRLVTFGTGARLVGAFALDQPLLAPTIFSRRRCC